MPYRPDALKDTTRRRKRKVDRHVGDGQGVIPRLLVATGHGPLIWLIVPIARCPGPEFYSRSVSRFARDLADEIGGEAPGLCVLQRGGNGGVHLNLILPAAAVPARRDLPPGTHAKPVTDLVGLDEYLAGPADQAASKVKDPRTGWRTPSTLEALAAAEHDLLTARAQARTEGRKLPRMSWTRNLPRLKPDAEVGINDRRVSSPCPPPPRPCHDRARDLLDQGLTRGEVAARLGITDRTLRRWAAAGFLDAHATDSQATTHAGELRVDDRDPQEKPQNFPAPFQNPPEDFPHPRRLNQLSHTASAPGLSPTGTSWKTPGRSACSLACATSTPPPCPPTPTWGCPPTSARASPPGTSPPPPSP